MFPSSSGPPPPDPSPSSMSPPNPAPLFPNRELTLSYLCESKEPPPPPQATAAGEAPPVAPSAADPPAAAGSAVERDFLHLSGSKRHGHGQDADAAVDKKAKAAVSNNPLDLSLSLNSAEPTRFTNNSESYGISYSCSVPFSHNPSCSLTSHYDWSSKNETTMYYAGEGTNGSVHSRFRPVGDGGVLFANAALKDATAGILKPGNSGDGTSISFFPSELPARAGRVNVVPPVASVDSGRNVNQAVAKPDKLLREIVSGSVISMAQMLHDLPNETLQSLREAARAFIVAPDRRNDFESFQRKLERRSDLSAEVLGRCHRTQLEILVAFKTGMANFVTGKGQVPSNELVEMFLLTRCPNLNCRNVVPVDDCDCKICSSKKGFCSACMCPVCHKFDCAANTCSWVGCDVCSHWCHTACGLERNLIRPGPTIKRAMGTTEMQFQCLGCDHASEMYGFVKEVFNCCAKDWTPATLMKELDYVKKIFAASEDFEGKGLHAKAEEVLNMLLKKYIAPSDATHNMLEFFKYGVTEFSVTGKSTGIFNQGSQPADTISLPLPTPSGSANATFNIKAPNSILDPKMAFGIKATPSFLDSKMNALPAASGPSNATFSLKASTSMHEIDPSFNMRGPSLFLESKIDTLKAMAKPISIEPPYTASSSKDDDVQSLETIVKCKEAEAKLFQKLADDARREVENYRQIIRVRSEKLEEEYASKVEKLCLQEMEEKRHKKIEEVKLLESSHCDYQKMKMRMQAEIASLLERMEATKKMWA